MAKKEENLIPARSSWKNKPTVAIRVPEKFKDQILKFATLLDSDFETAKIYKLRSQDVIHLKDLGIITDDST